MSSVRPSNSGCNYATFVLSQLSASIPNWMDARHCPFLKWFSTLHELFSGKLWEQKGLFSNFAFFIYRKFFKPLPTENGKTKIAYNTVD